jgi:hypothetical protein
MVSIYQFTININTVQQVGIKICVYKRKLIITIRGVGSQWKYIPAPYFRRIGY